MLTFLFPPFCLGCGYVGRYLCDGCKKKLKESVSVCLYCNKTSHLGLTHAGCKKEKGIDAFVSSYFYGGLLQNIVYKIKYKSALAIIEKECLFSSVVRDVVLSWVRLFPSLVFQPIPLHKKKEAQRGFNQARYLAEDICRVSGVGARVSNMLSRDIYTPSQTTMTSNRKRRENVRGAFSLCVPNIKRMCVVLVDDVVTSGATVCEAAKTLKEGGAKNVFVLALARG